jgi:hypothetical protein
MHFPFPLNDIIEENGKQKKTNRKYEIAQKA